MTIDIGSSWTEALAMVRRSGVVAVIDGQLDSHDDCVRTVTTEALFVALFVAAAVYQRPDMTHAARVLDALTAAQRQEVGLCAEAWVPTQTNDRLLDQFSLILDVLQRGPRVLVDGLYETVDASWVTKRLVPASASEDERPLNGDAA